MALTTIPVELVTLDDGVTITVDDNSDTLTLTSTDADAASGPILNFYRNSSSAADADLLGKIDFTGKNDAGSPEDVTYIRMFGKVIDASDGTEDGQLHINTMVGGSITQRVTMSPTELIINDASADLDFRVESNGKQYMLFVDGGNDVVGIGTSVPASYNANADNVVIYDSTGHTGITIAGDTDDYGNIYFAQGTSGSDAYRGYIQYGHSAVSDSTYRDKMTFGTATLERLIIDGSGHVTMPAQPAFSASVASTQSNLATGQNVDIVFGTEIYDVGSNFASNTFTAPVAGKYQLSYFVRLDAIDTAASYYYLMLKTTNRNYSPIYAGTTFGAADPTYMSLTFSILADMDANDTAKVTFDQTAGTSQVDVADGNFTGILIA